MYDILFIDDNFAEIQDTFWALQHQNIRCYYWDGDEENKPKNKIVFKNLSFICLDFLLENRGINDDTYNINNKNIYSTLAGVITTAVKIEQLQRITIIVSTGRSTDFQEQELKRYLQDNTVDIEIEQKKIEQKGNKFSTLHQDQQKIQKITDTTYPELFRSLFIAQAIKIENLIYAQLLNKKYLLNVNEENFRKFLQNLKLNFKEKINLYCLIVHDQYKDALHEVKQNRDNFAHSQNIEIDYDKNIQKLEKFEELYENIQKLD